jgi:hypothetical protein
MSKNNKLSISVAAVLKKMAHRSFLVFLSLLFFSAVIAALIAFNPGQSVITDGSDFAVSNSAIFGVSRAEEYREVFSIIEQRREDNGNSVPADYSRIFKELTE